MPSAVTLRAVISCLRENPIQMMCLSFYQYLFSCLLFSLTPIWRIFRAFIQVDTHYSICVFRLGVMALLSDPMRTGRWPKLEPISSLVILPLPPQFPSPVPWAFIPAPTSSCAMPTLPATMPENVCQWQQLLNEIVIVTVTWMPQSLSRPVLFYRTTHTGVCRVPTL